MADAVKSIENGIPVAKALEKFHQEFHSTLEFNNIDLWYYVRRNGQLSVSEARREFRRNSDGSMRVVETEAESVYAVLPGYRFCDPTAVKFASKLDVILSRIRPLVFRSPSNEIAQWDDRRRHQVSELLSRNVSRARELLAEVDELRRFAEPVSINTLRSWGEQPGCPLPRYFKHTGKGVVLGRNSEQCLTVAVPEQLGFPIGRIDFWTDLSPRERTSLDL